MNQILKGTFTSSSSTLPQFVYIPSQIDSFETVNETRVGQAEAVRFFWRRSGGVASLPAMPSALGGFSQTTAGVTAKIATANLGFTYVNTSTMAPGPLVATTAGTNVTSPVYSTATTVPLTTESIVRIVGTGHTNLNGLDFTVGAIDPGVSFTMKAVLATAPGQIAGAGNYRVIAPSFAAYQMFYPAQRNIANIVAATGVVTTFVDHGYAVGEQVRFNIPDAFGMTELEGITANILTVPAANTFTTDVDMSAFTTFVFPTFASTPFVYAQVVPVGNKPARDGNFIDAIRNGSYTAMILAPGAGFPGGNSGDVISWTATTADNL